MAELFLAPLRGVTIRCFRHVFAAALTEAGFTEAITPFIAANEGVDPLKDRELRRDGAAESLRLTPQFIGKSPSALRTCLERVKSAGYTTADLNCGCPFPMIRRKGRGSGLLRTPDVLREMLEVGCEVMGAGNFSIKTRLGVERPDELLVLMPLVNLFPLRFMTLHARTACQMYDGPCDWAAYGAVKRVCTVPLVRNGDLKMGETDGDEPVMIGRAFIRSLGERTDIADLLTRYAEESRAELSGERPILGRLKELVAYWADSPRWSRAWTIAKLARRVDEFLAAVRIAVASPCHLFR